MVQGDINDLLAFIAVASERSFTKAAGRRGLSTSALSHAMRRLEARLGIRLLARTTRSVAPTEAGERLLGAIAPLFDQIDREVETLSALRDRPGGKIRLTCTEAVLETVLRPKLKSFLDIHPDIKVEISIDYGFTDIVEGRFDAGVRIGESISKDMIAVRIGPDWRFAVVAAPGYLSRHPRTR